MPKFFDELPPRISSWIEKQKMFWVATAPLTSNGHVNVSPKGYEGTFHIINSKKVWYEDMSGSGIETIAHVRENGRMTIMFCAFEGAPQIVRLFGTGTVHEVGTSEYDAIIPLEKRCEGSRSVIMLDIHQVSSSCGYGVPFYTYKAPRNTLRTFLAKMEQLDINAAASGNTPHDEPARPWPEKGIRAMWEKSNLTSLDGLPGLQSALDSALVFVDRTGALNELSKGGHGNPHWVQRWMTLLDLKFIAGAAVGVAASIISVKCLAAS